MRKIKFRAWLREPRKIAEVYMVKFPKYQYPYVISSYIDERGKQVDDSGAYDEGNRNSNIILMQYTGVKDKNDIEIYEGDIVKAFGSMWTVEYRENDSAFRLVKHNETKSIRSLHSSSYEVIGNVYENLELLENAG